jgi:ATP phosphoribosyltransferase
MKRGNRFATIGHKIFDPKKVYKNYSDTIIFAIPSGSLYSTTIMLFGLAGYQLELRGERSFKPSVRGHKDIKLVVARAEEIPHLIESEEIDIGLTGIDLVEEMGVSVTDLADLQYNEHGKGTVNWVLAVPKEKVKNYRSLHDFSRKKISTELVNITRQYFLKHNVNVSIEPSIGTTEAKAPFLADAIVDLCETGESLRDNGLVPLYNVMSSAVHLFANNHSMGYGWKRRKIEEITEKMKLGARKLPKNPKHFIKLPNN